MKWEVSWCPEESQPSVAEAKVVLKRKVRGGAGGQNI